MPFVCVGVGWQGLFCIVCLWDSFGLRVGLCGCSYKDTLCNLAWGINFLACLFAGGAHQKTAKNMTKNLCGRVGERRVWVFDLSHRVEQFQLFCQVGQVLVPVLFRTSDAFMPYHVLGLPDIVRFQPVHNYRSPDLSAVDDFRI